MDRSANADVACLGGGVIGLMTAWRLALRGLRCVVYDSGPLAREASWAGAGIIMPARDPSGSNPLELLRAASFRRYEPWMTQLQAESGIDTGFRRSGGLFPITSTQRRSALEDSVAAWTAAGIECSWLNDQRIAEIAPQINAAGGVFLPEVCQVRNPRLMQALVIACTSAGVRLFPRRAVTAFEGSGTTCHAAVLADGERITAGHFLCAAGAWTGQLLRDVGISLPIVPVHGQILAIDALPESLRQVVQVGKRYLVPRGDGVVLVGSTEEETGFVKQVTASGLAGLRQFAEQILPSLRQRPALASWSGLRPGSPFHAPIIGRVGPYENLWVASGHFRHGLQLAPGTAELIADWVTGKPSFIPLGQLDADADRSGHSSLFPS